MLVGGGWLGVVGGVVVLFGGGELCMLWVGDVVLVELVVVIWVVGLGGGFLESFVGVGG